MSPEDVDFAVKAVTYGLIASTYYMLWKNRRMKHSNAYFRGRLDEWRAIEESRSPGDYAFIVRSQIAEYLGEKEAQRWIADIGLGEDDEADA